ncbi:MAG: protein kinase [Lachnospiraceae bacterium]|nr:protein kinase [Lachnospiraceae bacterium]
MGMEEGRGSLCYNCFREIPEQEGACPYCGFDLKENEKMYPGALRAGTVLKGRYLLGRVLGQGGFGITYLAWDESLKARVAVKEYMPGELATRLEHRQVVVRTAARQEEFAYGQERFREEARILAKFMGQPNIAGVTDYFDENGTSYFVMDYIEGISFKTYIAQAGGRVSPEEALDVMIPVLRDLTEVHGEGLIHRDVTPDNIYITKDGNVKLLDFGSARYSLGDKSKSLDVILKVGYAPKEQYIRRGRQGPYTDVYSCAACLYAAITGYLPPESLERLDHDTLVPPSEAGAEIPLYLERAILKGLAVQPEDRFQTAGEFLEALESQNVVELTGSGREETLQKQQVRSQEKRKKGRLAAAVCGIGALALAAVLFLGTGQSGTPDSAPASEPAGDVQGTNVPTQETLSPQESRRMEEAAAPKVTICGESYSTALRELRLEEAEFEEADYEAISQMTGLERLEIVDSPISQLDFLKNLTNLKRLHIRGSREPAGTFSDLSALAGLTNLEDLYLYLDGVSDLNGLSGMSGLKSLVLTGNMEIADLSPLAGLTKLQSLEVPLGGENVGVDLSPLAGLTDLRTLRTGSNVTDLTPLSGLTGLRELDLTYGGYSARDSKEYRSLEPLSSLTGLTSLTIRNLWVSDLSPLSGLTKLRSLTIYNGASIEDLSPLAGLTGLKSLTIRGARHELDTSAVSQVSQISIEP